MDLEKEALDVFSEITGKKPKDYILDNYINQENKGRAYLGLCHLMLYMMSKHMPKGFLLENILEDILLTNEEKETFSNDIFELKKRKIRDVLVELKIEDLVNKLEKIVVEEDKEFDLEESQNNSSTNMNLTSWLYYAYIQNGVYKDENVDYHLKRPSTRYSSTEINEAFKSLIKCNLIK